MAAAVEFAIANSPIAICILMVCNLLIQSAAGELRPSDHGLGYQQQSTPAGDSSPPAMMSFFGSSPGDSPPPTVGLPKATNSTDNSWLPGRTGGKNRVKEILLITSLACGITGIALLVASALLLLFKFRRERRLDSESTANQPPQPPAGVYIK